MQWHVPSSNYDVHREGGRGGQALHSNPIKATKTVWVGIDFSHSHIPQACVDRRAEAGGGGLAGGGGVLHGEVDLASDNDQGRPVRAPRGRAGAAPPHFLNVGQTSEGALDECERREKEDRDQASLP